MIAQFYLGLLGKFTFGITLSLLVIDMLRPTWKHYRCLRALASLLRRLREIPAVFVGTFDDAQVLCRLYGKLFESKPSPAELMVDSPEHMYLVALFSLLTHPRLHARIHRGIVQQVDSDADPQSMQYIRKPMVWLEYSYHNRNYIGYSQEGYLAVCDQADFILRARIVSAVSYQTDEVLKNLSQVLQELSHDPT